MDYSRILLTNFNFGFPAVYCGFSPHFRGFSASRRLAHRALSGLAVASTLLAVEAAPASAGTGIKVTFVARTCPEYTDIYANRSRNNILESLNDLGPDTNYASGQSINPVKEDAAPQDKCTPLVNWKFTMGTGYASKAVTGPWGSLSKVTNPFATSITTVASTPELDTLGSPTGKSLAGAVTIELSQAELNQASHGANSLWAQGGTPTDPVLNTPYPGQYGFAAMRCGQDNLNGDNVEWINFPNGMKHAYCYAYYVKPPPTSATVIVKKHLIGAPAGVSQTFRFVGSISYNSDSSFNITSSASSDGSISFYRGDVAPPDSPWSFTEEPAPNFTLTSTTCSSAGGSQWTISPNFAAVDITKLVGGDTVTCTYNNTYVPPPGGLAIEKITLGGTGSFSWLVTPLGGGLAKKTSATTETEGTPVAASPALTSLTPGTYRITENQPTAADGTWSLAKVVCNGTRLNLKTPLDVEVPSGGSTLCQFTNQFTPKGRITLRKVTYGATGQVNFQVDGGGDEPTVTTGSATTTDEGVAAFAAGDYHDYRDLGRYTVTELAGEPVKGGYWALSSVVCDGLPVPADRGQIELNLTTQAPVRDCTFYNTFVKDGEPLEPPGPDPNGPFARITITKKTVKSPVYVGQRMSWNLAVRNHGPQAANKVFVTDVLPKHVRNAEASSSRGPCQVRGRKITCRLGYMKVGARASLKVSAVTRRVGALVNTAAVTTSTGVSRLSGMRAQAHGLVIRRVRVTG